MPNNYISPKKKKKKKKKKKILFLKPSTFPEYLEFIYSRELEIKKKKKKKKKKKSETITSSSYLDLYFQIDNEYLTISLYEKRDDFNILIANFRFLAAIFIQH